ncbi:MFS transporter [Klebsiella pneumoniae]|uniref:MFS transporter n=1 Tax=Klebsiella pneumoniae TaxID=573 RepID=UPI003AF3D41A
MLNSTVAPLISAGSITIVKDILDEHQFHPANALVNISFDVCYLLGAFLSGIIIDITNHQVTFLLSASLFIVATILLLLIEPQENNEQGKEEENSTRKTVLQYLKSNPNYALDGSQTVLFSAFGGGLTWGNLIVKI